MSFSSISFGLPQIRARDVTKEEVKKFHEAKGGCRTHRLSEAGQIYQLGPQAELLV
jgi:hypothetical protein